LIRSPAFPRLGWDNLLLQRPGVEFLRRFLLVFAVNDKLLHKRTKLDFRAVFSVCANSGFSASCETAGFSGRAQKWHQDKIKTFLTFRYGLQKLLIGTIFVSVLVYLIRKTGAVSLYRSFSKNHVCNFGNGIMCATMLLPSA
jgi:hypothetical protein